MQLWKHPNGVYYVLHGPRLKKQLSTRTRDRREADTFIANFIAGHDNPQPDAPSVGEILEGYRASRSTEVRAPNALKFAVQALTPALGKLQPVNLLPPTIKKYARERGAADGTILRDIGVLRAALRWAHENAWIAVVPTISNPVASPRGRERWMPKPEARLLVAQCQVPHLRLFVKMGLFTLARTGAILECRWTARQDETGRALPYVNMDRRLVDYGDGWGNKRRAIVPINDELFEDLKAARHIACTDYVIEYAGGPIRTVKNAFAAACGRAGIEGVTPHILRHTGCTWLVEAGLSYEIIGKMAGDTAETIERIYGHHSPDYLKGAADALKLAS